METPLLRTVRTAAGWLIFSALAIALPVSASTEMELYFEQISVESGLSQSTVTSILQDRRGFLWIGTDYGLNRYDGRSMTVYLPDSRDPFSIGGPRIRCLEEGTSGTIWVGTFDGGLSGFDPRAGRFDVFRHDPRDASSLRSNRVTALTTDHEGRLWVGTAAGLDRMRTDGRSFEHIDLNGDRLEADPTVHALLEDGSGRLWIGTDDGLFSIVRAEGTLEVFKHDPPGRDRFAGPVTALARSGDDGLWIGTETGLARFKTGAPWRWWDAEKADPGALPSALIDSLLVDHRGRLWVGTSGGGLSWREPDGEGFNRVPVTEEGPHGVHGSEIAALFEDRSRILWIGTDFGGLDKLDLKGRPFRFLDQENGLPSSTVLAVSADHHDTLWIGTRSGTVEVDRRRNGSTPVADRPGCGALNRPAYSFLETHGGRTMLVGTWNSGVVEIDLTRNRCKQRLFDPDLPNEIGANTVMALLEDTRGRRWIGTWGGLIRTGPDGEDPVRFPVEPGRSDRLQSELILCLTQTSDGTVWIGTDGGGLSRYDDDTDRFETFRHTKAAGSLSNDSVTWISEGPDGALWIGTAAGLNRMDRTTGRFTTYGVDNGLPSDAVTAVQIDDSGRVWVAHFRGLSCLIPDRDEIVTFETSDGVGVREFNRGATTRDTRGQLYFGGVEGLVYFDPKEIRRNPYPAVPLITAIRVFDELISPAGAVEAPPNLELPYDQNFLTFSFVGLEFTAPDRNRLSYRLVGADRRWVEAENRREVSYGHLRPGRYTFQVRAANNHGVMCTRPAEVTVVIRPPFWQTWWFRVGVILAGLAFVAMVFVWRTRALRLRLMQQERLVEERTSQLAEVNRQLHALTVTDPLTGVANRRRLDRVLDQEWRRAGRFERMVAVVIADIDDFKAYNDTRGHNAGDDCLRRVAAAMSAVVNRPGDILARFGGEEFVAVFAETNHASARQLAERMRAAVEELAIPHPGAGSKVVTVSVGVAVTTPAADQTVESLIEAADAAMYEAKAAGKNRVAVGRV